jgi:hypothetical protein
MPPKGRDRPGTAPWAAPKSSTDWPNYRPTDAELLDELYRRGFKLAARCIRCGHWMAADVPLDHIGPKCRRKLDARQGAS